MVTLTLLVFMAASTEFMPVALLPAIARSLGVSEPLTGLLLTSFAFGVAACAVPLARATIRWNRRPLLIWAVLGYSLANALIALAGSFAVAAAGRAIAGICHAVLLSVVPVIAARLVQPGRLGRSVAALWIGTAMAYLAGIPVGAAFGTASSGWRWVFLTLSVGAAVLGLVARWSVPSMPSTAEKGHMTTALGMPAPALLFVGAATTSVLLGTFVIYSYIVPLLISAGVAGSSVSLVLLLFGSAAVGGLWWAGSIVDRRPRGGLIVALIMLIGGMALFRGWPIGGVAVWGFAYGSLATYFNTAALRAAPESLDIASAFSNAGFNLGVGGGALVGSAVLVVLGQEWLIPVAIGFVVIGLSFVIFARRSGFPVLPQRVRRSP